MFAGYSHKATLPNVSPSAINVAILGLSNRTSKLRMVIKNCQKSVKSCFLQ